VRHTYRRPGTSPITVAALELMHVSTALATILALAPGFPLVTLSAAHEARVVEGRHIS